MRHEERHGLLKLAQVDGDLVSLSSCLLLFLLGGISAWGRRAESLFIVVEVIDFAFWWLEER